MQEENNEEVEESPDADVKAKDARLDESDDVAIDERSIKERMAAYAAIRKFRQDEKLDLQYKTTAPNPYKDDDAKRIEIYADDKGYKYWVDPSNDRLIQAGPSTGVRPSAHAVGTESRLAVSELRSRAVGIVSSQMPEFASRRSSFHPLEDNRNREVYFFRWDDFSQPAKESELPPFVQVGLYADGRLASYTNTLELEDALLKA